jgi:hypothetical protein
MSEAWLSRRVRLPRCDDRNASSYDKKVDGIEFNTKVQWIVREQT